MYKYFFLMLLLASPIISMNSSRIQHNNRKSGRDFFPIDHLILAEYTNQLAHPNKQERNPSNINGGIDLRSMTTVESQMKQHFANNNKYFRIQFDFDPVYNERLTTNTLLQLKQKTIQKNSCMRLTNLCKVKAINDHCWTFFIAIESDQEGRQLRQQCVRTLQNKETRFHS